MFRCSKFWVIWSCFHHSCLVILWLKKMSDEEGKWKHISTIFKTHDPWLSGNPINKLSQWAPSPVHCHITNIIFFFSFFKPTPTFFSSSSSSSFFLFLSFFFRPTPPFSYMHKFIPRNKNPHLIFVILVFDLRILGFRFGFSVFVGFFGGGCGCVKGCWRIEVLNFAKDGSTI